MKLRSGILFLMLAAGIGVISNVVAQKKKGGEETEEVNKVAEYRAKSRENLKPHRFDGSKVTFFNYQYYEYKKEIEVLLFNGIDYKFSFNTDGVPKSLDIKIYDKNDTAKERILLYEEMGVAQRDITIFSKDLLKKLQETKSSITSLKRIYIEYHIPVGNNKVAVKVIGAEEEEDEATSTPQEKGVIVLSYGYKNT
jgi:hypothetical protein